MQSDAWRLQQLYKSAADPRHPWSRFNAGNLHTLADATTQSTCAPSQSVQVRLVPASTERVCVELVTPAPAPALKAATARSVRSALLELHGTLYSANLMSLAVLGRESLDVLEQMVAPLFAAVRNSSVPPPAWPIPPYPDERARQHVRVVPVRDHSYLTVSWALPPIRNQYLSKPYKYVSHLIGHEGEGSLLSALKARGWAEELLAGETQSHSDFATFVVTVTLTDAGNRNIEQLVPLIFACLQMLRSVPPPRWIFDEIGGVSRMRLRFLDAIEPSQAVLHLAQALQQVPPRHALVSSFVYDMWSPTEVVTLLSLLTPQRASIVHMAPQHAATATLREPYYGTAYSVAPVSEALLAACSAPEQPGDLRWPIPNPFIPTDFTLLCDARPADGDLSGDVDGPPLPLAPSPKATSAAVLDAALAARGVLRPPRLICDREAIELWHKVDRTFRRPKTNLHVDVVTPAAYESPGAAILTALCFRLIADELTEFAYSAELAGLTYTVSRHTTGFFIIVEGHSDKLPLLLTRVLDKIASPTLEEARFGVQCEQELKSLRNWLCGAPREHARYAAAHLLAQQRWHLLEYLDFLTQGAAPPGSAVGIEQSGARARERSTLAGGGGATAVSAPATAAEGALRPCSRDGLTALHAALCARLRVTALCHGNTDRVVATAMVAETSRALGGRALTVEELPDPRCLRLPTGVEVVMRMHCSLYLPAHAQWLNNEESNSAVELSLQGELDVRPSSQIVELLSAILSSGAFDTLRTEEQLGYLVDLGVRYDHGVYGLRVAVQSATHEPTYLDERIEAFLATVPKRLAGLTPEAFANHRDALIKMRLAPPKTLREETSLHWSEITNGTYDFGRDEGVAQALASITQADVVQYWAEHFDVAAPNRRKLSSHVYAPHHGLPERRETGAGGRKLIYVDGFEEVQKFKKTLTPFPPPPRVCKGEPMTSRLD